MINMDATHSGAKTQLLRDYQVCLELIQILFDADNLELSIKHHEECINIIKSLTTLQCHETHRRGATLFPFLHPIFDSNL